MPPYRNQVSPQDRWAIVAYIKALQLSQNATVADVPPASRAELSGTPTTATAGAAGASHGGGH
jgi:hypothetical protein